MAFSALRVADSSRRGSDTSPGRSSCRFGPAPLCLALLRLLAAPAVPSTAARPEYARRGSGRGRGPCDSDAPPPSCRRIAGPARSRTVCSLERSGVNVRGCKRADSGVASQIPSDLGGEARHRGNRFFSRRRVPGAGDRLSTRRVDRPHRRVVPARRSTEPEVTMLIPSRTATRRARVSSSRWTPAAAESDLFA
jgi:hypothetical protein